MRNPYTEHVSMQLTSCNPNGKMEEEQTHLRKNFRNFSTQAGPATGKLKKGEFHVKNCFLCPVVS